MSFLLVKLLVFKPGKSFSKLAYNGNVSKPFDTIISCHGRRGGMHLTDEIDDPIITSFA